jgi:hypothetical protein
MRYVVAFLRFWYDFLVGDDPLAAAAVVAAIGLTALLTHHGVNAWWAMPILVVAVLAGSLRRAVRRRQGQLEQRVSAPGSGGHSGAE